MQVFGTIARRRALQRLIARLEALQPDAVRLWGTLTAHEMLCHLGDASEMVTRVRPRARPLPAVSRPLHKAVGLWAPVRWRRGMPTNPMHDPRGGGTRPRNWEDDRLRVVRALESIASAPEGALEPVHGLFGTMSTRDWQRWAYRHTDHHLRQFGA